MAVVGPTATGKTALAIHLARAFDGEVINSDSRLFYRGFDIGTAKPTAAERGALPHRLIDVVDPHEGFSLGRWLQLSPAALGEGWEQGRVPIAFGGTGRSVWALLEGWRLPRAPPQSRRSAPSSSYFARCKVAKTMMCVPGWRSCGSSRSRTR